MLLSKQFTLFDEMFINEGPELPRKHLRVFIGSHRICSDYSIFFPKRYFEINQTEILSTKITNLSKQKNLAYKKKYKKKYCIYTFGAWDFYHRRFMIQSPSLFFIFPNRLQTRIATFAFYKNKKFQKYILRMNLKIYKVSQNISKTCTLKS